MLQAPVPADDDPDSQLIQAVKAEKTDEVHTLLATPNTISTTAKALALSFSAISGNLILTQSILVLARHDLSAENKGYALIDAATHGRLQVVEALIVNLLANEESSGIPRENINRSFMSAVIIGHMDVARILLHYADHLISPKNKEIALYYARQRGENHAAQLHAQLQALFQPASPVISPAFTTKRKEATQDALSPPGREEALAFERAKMPRF